MSAENIQETVLSSIENGIGTLTLNRPHSFNSISIAMLEVLIEKLDALLNDGNVQAIILTGADKAFCAGADQAEMVERTAQEWEFLVERYLVPVRMIAAADKPVIATLNGDSVGGGLGSQVVRFCRLFDASRIIAVDKNPAVLEAAKAAGAYDVILANDEPANKQVRKLTQGMGVDVAFEFVGLSQTIDTTVRCLRRGGSAVVVGIGMEKIQLPAVRSFVGNEYELRGSMGPDLQDLKDVVALVEAGKLQLEGATHGIANDEVDNALVRLAEGWAEHARYVVTG